MNKKKIMLLGGNYFQMTATKAAKQLGLHVISVDYLPDNPGHKFADEYHNVSTIDKDAVLKLAQELHIDGIVSYASDVSAPTAAYVAEAMGLPTNPYDAVVTLTQKNHFRQFMRKNGLPSPQGRNFRDEAAALEYFRKIPKPVIIKPIDASGSKGVTQLADESEFHQAFQEAISYSLSKTIIIEQFIVKKGYQIDGDGFVLDGKICFFGVMDQHKDLSCAPYAPIGLSWPSKQAAEIQEAARNQIQTIFDLLGMRFGAFNFEYLVDADDNVYILEIGPRNGGNFIPDTIDCACGIDLAQYTIKAALGMDCSSLKDVKPALKCASSYIVHSLSDGIFSSLDINPFIRENILKECLFVQPGAPVKRFKNGGCSIGAMVIGFDDIDTMCHTLDNMNEYIKVLTQ